MRVKTVKVAIAAAALGFASVAHADFARTFSSGGSDFLFGFLSGNSSYIKDLSINFDSFNTNATQSFALDGFSFTSQQVSSGLFQVLAGNTTTGVPDLYSTVSGNPLAASIGITDYLQLTDPAAGFDGSVEFYNGAEGVPVLSTNPAEPRHISNILGFRWGNNSSFNASNGGNVIASLYKFDSDDQTGAVTTSVVGSWKLQAGAGGAYSLVYAPVPEPSTYAMLAAGLVGLGAIARRKKRG